MNTTKETETTAQLFLQMVGSLNNAEASEVPSVKVDHLQQASEDAKTIINRLALFGGAVHTGLDAVRNIVESLRETDPALHEEINRLIGRILSLQDTFRVFYGEEVKFCTEFDERAAFCDRYNRAVRRLTAVMAGADPKSGAKISKNLKKIEALTQPAEAGN